MHEDDDSRRSSHATRKPEARDDDPSTISDLPQYVFLVGFGVCAVVLQVMFRKFVGRSPSLR